MQGVILKDSKDSLELVDEMESKAAGDQTLLAKATELRERIKMKEERALQELDMLFKQKEHQLDKDVSSRLMENESRRLAWLKEEQLKEKQEIFQKHLPQDSAVKDFMQEAAEEEAKELE